MRTCSWPKTKKEAVGRRAQTLRRLKNHGGTIINKGRVVELLDYYRGWAVLPVRKPGARITRVPQHDLKLLRKKGST